MSSSIGVVVPAYRPDVSVLTGHIDRLHAAVAPEPVMVALDDPVPGVADRVRDSDAIVDVSPTRRGKGAAVTRGFDRLDTDRLAFSDADASTPAESVARVVGALDDAAVAVGTRRHPSATIETHQSLVRRRLGDGFAHLARHVLGVDLTDFQCGAKAMTASAWRRLREHVSATGFGWDVELVAFADALGMAIAEVPVRWRDRPESSVPPVRTALSLLGVLARTRIQTSRLEAAPVTDASGIGDRSRQVRSDGSGD
ncbi:MAG: glycosyltransferase [Halobacteriaceae archaeon]